MKKMKNIFFVLLFPCLVSANSISDTYRTSKLYKSNTLSGSLILRETTNENFGVALNGDYSTSTVKSSDYTGADVENKSVDVDGGATFETPANWSFGFLVALGNQSTDNLQSTATSIFVGKKFVFGETPLKDKENGGPTPKFVQEPAGGDDIEFLPSFALRCEFTNNNLSQKQSGRRSVGNRLSLGQTSSELTLAVSPWRLLDFTANVKRYSYNRDLDTYIDLLESPAATRRFGGNFGSSLTSLSSTETNFALSFHLTDQWDLDVTTSKIKDAPAPQNTSEDKSISIGYSAEAGWGLSVGTGQTFDSASGDRDSYQTLSAQYHF